MPLSWPASHTSRIPPSLGLYSTQSSNRSIGERTGSWSRTPGAEGHLSQAQAGSTSSVAGDRPDARSAGPIRHGCTEPTSSISSTSSIPPGFAIQKCDSCHSEFLDPRPTESELPPFYPSDYHAYNENHGGVARLLVEPRARSRARFYGRLIRDRPGRLFDVGTGDCRHFDELRRFLDLECAGIEIQPEVAAKGRARGYDVLEGTARGRRPDRSRREIRRRLHEPRPRARGHPRTMLERACDLLRPGGYVIGQLPTVTSWENKLFGRNWGGYHYPRHLQIPSKVGLAGLLEDVGLADVKHPIGAPHPNHHLVAEHAWSAGVGDPACTTGRRRSTRASWLPPSPTKRSRGCATRAASSISGPRSLGDLRSDPADELIRDGRQSDEALTQRRLRVWMRSGRPPT